MTQIVVIYATFPDKNSALTVGRIIVQEKLVACINIIPQIYAVYVWEGKLEEEEEVIMLAKTTKGQEEKVIERINALHPYSCPCIVVLPVEGGNAPFLEWVRESTVIGDCYKEEL